MPQSRKILCFKVFFSHWIFIFLISLSPHLSPLKIYRLACFAFFSEKEIEKRNVLTPLVWLEKVSSLPYLSVHRNQTINPSNR